MGNKNGQNPQKGQQHQKGEEKEDDGRTAGTMTAATHQVDCADAECRQIGERNGGGEGEFGKLPKFANCPYCRKEVLTSIRYKDGALSTHGCICWSSFGWGGLPRRHEFMDVVHECPECGTRLGKLTRTRSMSHKMFPPPPFLIAALLLAFFSAAFATTTTSSNAAHGLLLTRDQFAAINRFFTERGWFLDHGGGLAVRVVQPNSNGTELVYVTTNNYYKNAYDPEDTFIFDYAQLMLPHHLANKTLPQAISASRDPDSSYSGGPLNVMRYANAERAKNANFAANDIVAVTHTHSKYASLLSGLYRPGDVALFSGEQMLTGIENRATGRQLLFNETLAIPIIPNSPNEGLNTEPVIEALRQWPNASAVLVHRHGIYALGQFTWGRTKQMAECLEALLELEYNRRQARALGLLRNQN